MSDGELTARERDEITKVRTMPDVRQERRVLLVHGLPIRAVHLGVVEVIALRPPGFLEDLGPLRARIDEHLELADVERALTDFARLVGSDNSPAALRRTARRLIQQLLVIARQR